MKRLLFVIPVLLAMAACQTAPGTDAVDNRLLVADACSQAANAETALAAEIRAGRLSAGQVDQVAAAKAVVDTLCLDQSAVASSPALTARLRAAVPTIVALVVKE